MVLSDREIIDEQNKNEIIQPFDADCLQPASYDLKLGMEILRYFPGHKISLGETYDSYEKISADGYTMKPGEFILASTKENIYIPKYLVGEVSGKSSIARLGLVIHQTAGWIDSGFEGNITLELVNNSKNFITLKEDFPIAQLVLHKLTSECLKPYNGKYQKSMGVVKSRTKREE